MIKKIFVAGDHVCYENREIIIKAIKEKYPNIEVKNLGSFSFESVDYPDYSFALAHEVVKNSESIGVMTCGSGVGVSICCNKVKGIRATLAYNTEIAKLSRQHNDCNVVCVANRFNSLEDNIEIIFAFIESHFEGGRHENRVNKIIDYENRNMK